MCLAQGPQRSDAGEARTRGPLVSSQALYHWATALPMTNSEDAGKMQHNVTFHQGLHYLQKPKWSPEKGIHSKLEIVTCDPSIHTMNQPKFIVSYQMEEHDIIQKVNTFWQSHNQQILLSLIINWLHIAVYLLRVLSWWLGMCEL